MRAAPTLLALVAAAAFGGFAATGMQLMLDRPAAAEPAPPATAATVPAAAALPNVVNGTPMPSLAPMLKRVLPAVVSVNTEQRVRVNTPFGDDPVFRRMFGIPEERIARSLGSGVIVDTQRGLVLTNNHVVENADAVQVQLADGRTVKAEFLGSDPDTDVALMRIPAQNLVAIPLANSDQLQIGDFVVAIGNPFGVGQTVTSGIVSAVGRNNLPGVGFQNFIQTDASINPGNSGGALVDLNGRLVGINTASFNPRGSMAGNIGLGFAIPINLANGIMRQLLANDGQVRRGTLGVDTQDAQGGGARVTRVYPGSSAANVGLRPGDVIVGANGERITSAEDFRNFQGLQAANARLNLDIRRNGQPMQLSAGLQEQRRDGASLDPRLEGVTFGELPESLRRQGASGVQVTAVAAGSRAARAGLRGDDVILEATTGRFTDLASFRASFQQPPQQLAFRIWREGNRIGTLVIP